jgi:hypothetical protein
MKGLMTDVVQGRWTLLFITLFANYVADANVTPESTSNDWS